MILIKQGRVIDPSCQRDEVTDLYIEDGIVKKIGKHLEDSVMVSGDKKITVIDAKGCYVMPGLIDLHVHLRDPGLEYKETIETGCAAAANGGFTSIFAMPNTKPVADNPEVIEYVHRKGKETGVHVYQVGAITKSMAGCELSDLEGMFQAGCIAISEDGKSVMDSGLYREAMKIAKKHHIPVFAHCEDIRLVQGGVMNQDKNAQKLGLKGISNTVEDIIVARDILLAKETGVKLHLCHCSTKDSVTMVQKAKEEGIQVTAEVCPHHFTLSSEDITADDGNFKMNPPLRGVEDVEELKRGMKEDIMDIISTDHAPHSKEEKQVSMAKAAFGIVGLETAVPLTITELVRTGILTPMQMAAKMSTNPAKVAGLDKGSLMEGKIADVVIIDPEESYTIQPEEFKSKGRNTPFAGKKVYGKVRYTISDGKIIKQP